jgi:hypothetical protein
MDTNDHDHQTLEPQPCAECGQLVALQDETRIGVSRIDGTPAPLCSPACVSANTRRILDEAKRCRCGALVDLATELLIRAGEVLGCQACRWSGSPLTEGDAPDHDSHYLSSLGAPLCRTTSKREGRAITLTTNRERVGCLVCVQLMGASPLGTSGAVGGVS